MDALPKEYAGLLYAMMLYTGLLGGLFNWISDESAYLGNRRAQCIYVMSGIIATTLSPMIIPHEILRAGQSDPIAQVKILSYMMACAIIAKPIIKMLTKRIFQS